MDPLDDEPAPADDTQGPDASRAQQDGGPRTDEEPLSAIRQRHQRARRRRALAISGALVVALVIGVLVHSRSGANPPTGAQESGYENTQSVPGAPALGPDLDVLWRVPAPPSGNGAVNARILPVDNRSLFVAKETAQGGIWVAELAVFEGSADHPPRRPPALLWVSTIEDPEGLGDAPMTYTEHDAQWQRQSTEAPSGYEIFIKNWAVNARTGAVRRAPWADSDAATPTRAVGTFNATVVACGSGCSGWAYSYDTGWTTTWTRDSVQIPHSYQQAEDEAPDSKGQSHIWALLDPDQDGALPILDTTTGEVRTPFPVGTSSGDVYAEEKGWTVVDEGAATVTSYSADGTPKKEGALAPDARSAAPLDDTHYYSHLTGAGNPDDPVARVSGQDCDSLIIGRPSEDPPALRVPAPARIATRTGGSCLPAFSLSSAPSSGALERAVVLTEKGGTNPSSTVLAALRTDRRPDGQKLVFPQDDSPAMAFVGIGSYAFLIGVDENGILGFIPKAEKK